MEIRVCAGACHCSHMHVPAWRKCHTKQFAGPLQADHTFAEATYVAGDGIISSLEPAVPIALPAEDAISDELPSSPTASLQLAAGDKRCVLCA